MFISLYHQRRSLLNGQNVFWISKNVREIHHFARASAHTHTTVVSHRFRRMSVFYFFLTSFIIYDIFFSLLLFPVSCPLEKSSIFMLFLFNTSQPVSPSLFIVIRNVHSSLRSVQNLFITHSAHTFTLSSPFPSCPRLRNPNSIIPSHSLSQSIFFPSPCSTLIKHFTRNRLQTSS